MTQQEIEIDGLPEGWKAVAYRMPEIGEYMLVDSKIILCTMQYGDHELRLIVEKIQPRRIVLEETGEGNHTAAFHNDDGVWTYWKEVKE